MSIPYRDNLEHLEHELDRLDLLLERAVARFRRVARFRSETEFAGLYISDAEVDQILAERNGHAEEDQEDLETRIGTITATIDERIVASREAGVPLRLVHLCDVFSLGRAELDIVLLALAPELDLRYQRLYAYIQDDVNRKRPTIDLALRLFCRDEADRLMHRRMFAPAAPLMAIPILTRHEDAADRPTPLIGQSLHVEERVVEFLAGGDFIESRFATRGAEVRWVAPAVELDEILVRDEQRATLEFLASAPPGARAWTCVLIGGRGVGKQSVAEAVAGRLDMPLLVVDLASHPRQEADLRASMRAILREARLYSGAVYIDAWHRLAAEPNTPADDVHRIIVEMIEQFPRPVFLATESPWRPDRSPRRSTIVVELAPPDERERMALWQQTLSRRGIGTDADLAAIASAFRFSAGRISGAIDRALLRARLRGLDLTTIGTDDLVAACREESSRHIISFARRIKPRRRWEDVVLPAEVMMQLREFCRQVRYRTQVYGAWGFDAKLSSGKGTIALFTGSSGTGKTLSAEVLANELGIDLFRVDLATVVSKYIGETEKNLERVFTDAHDSNAILFFDEADALFGKRSEVKDAHDRYANIEINYLLQRVEEYEGVIILATNLSKNIDTAFLRRLHFSIEFPFPDERYRLHIWQRIFPASTPTADDVDLEFMARQFSVAGGNIRNVVLAAAFNAADDHTPVTMAHLILAMKREYQKLGKTCERSDFEQYYPLVR